jgi:mannose-6-phosphate isomerase
VIYRSKPVFSSRPWGDSDLNTIYGVDSEEPIGEVWLLSDTANMKTSLESSSSRLNPEMLLKSFADELCLGFL